MADVDTLPPPANVVELPPPSADDVDVAFVDIGVPLRIGWGVWWRGWGGWVMTRNSKGRRMTSDDIPEVLLALIVAFVQAVLSGLHPPIANASITNVFAGLIAPADYHGWHRDHSPKVVRLAFAWTLFGLPRYIGFRVCKQMASSSKPPRVHTTAFVHPRCDAAATEIPAGGKRDFAQRSGTCYAMSSIGAGTKRDHLAIMHAVIQSPWPSLSVMCDIAIRDPDEQRRFLEALRKHARTGIPKRAWGSNVLVFLALPWGKEYGVSVPAPIPFSRFINSLLGFALIILRMLFALALGCEWVRKRDERFTDKVRAERQRQAAERQRQAAEAKAERQRQAAEAKAEAKRQAAEAKRAIKAFWAQPGPHHAKPDYGRGRTPCICGLTFDAWVARGGGKYAEAPAKPGGVSASRWRDHRQECNRRHHWEARGEEEGV